jgi:hypothetical protein
LIKAISFVAFVFLTLYFASPRSEQHKVPENDAYAAVPTGDREALRELVNELIELQKQQQWSKMYDIVPVSDKSQSRDDFVRQHTRGSRLIDFDVDAVTPSPTSSSEWMVLGCAVFERRGQKKAWRSTTFASLSESRWFVSPVFIVVREHGGFTPCSTKTETREQKLVDMSNEVGRVKE